MTLLGSARNYGPLAVEEPDPDRGYAPTEEEYGYVVLSLITLNTRSRAVLLNGESGECLYEV